MKFTVFRQIDFTHPTGANLRTDLVTTEPCACGNRHCFTSAIQLTTTLYYNLDVYSSWAIEEEALPSNSCSVKPSIEPIATKFTPYLSDTL